MAKQNAELALKLWDQREEVRAKLRTAREQLRAKETESPKAQISTPPEMETQRASRQAGTNLQVKVLS